MKKLSYLTIVLTLFFMTNAQAGCFAKYSRGYKSDILFTLLQETRVCPKDVREFKNLLAEDGLKSLPALVANRGHHNPKLGSFSIFESVKGYSRLLHKEISPEHLYVGHFTDKDSQNQIVLDQTSAPKKLLIEAIAYDFLSGVFNFYELVGTESGPQWFYRGDSFDAYKDNKLLKIGRRPEFGTRMRCSGCHVSGGPIMKELSAPHNDWWTRTRGLPFGMNKPSLEIKEYMNNFIDASDFSKNVARGIELLEKKNFNPGLSIKEKLRPLFCTTEINLKSDKVPLSANSSMILVPSDALVDPFLAPSVGLGMRKNFYLGALKALGSRFPETSLLDADHAFLVPVKSTVNQLHVKKLITSRIIDEEFALDVLSVDFKNPVISSTRCELLKLIPEISNWKQGFMKKLSETITPSAQELYLKMKEINGSVHKENAVNYLKEKLAFWNEQKSVIQEVGYLNSLRLSVFKDEISQNPKGQILEPGFRVIFPVMREI